jgi:hypothetical protein
MMKDRKIVPLEERTARLTVLIDPRKKAVFERVCAAEDVTPSQVVRRLIREYIEARTGQSWSASGAGESPRAPPSPIRRPPRR